ncbi:hypothetical protein E2C01_051761 [Portunus trituberculatus]|uniref:Uncharacterized protein n=1 Tax=Portunus trituberculatus TaxID=210409 RepID=A0A5B7GML7_PORTR|nr:hypothetical protein [Portunus trituberculatus]
MAPGGEGRDGVRLGVPPGEIYPCVTLKGSEESLWCLCCRCGALLCLYCGRFRAA